MSDSMAPLYYPLSGALNIPRTRLDPELLSQLACHILVYADMLFSWQLLNKRLELLNTVKTSSFIKTPPQNLDMRFGAHHLVLVDA